MTNCGACDLGLPHEHNGYHPATFLYGSATAPEAARWWYEMAIESAKENNRLKDELREIKSHWLYRLIKRFYPDEEYVGCDCSPHDITTPGAAHADDCPMYD